ncbi:MAG: hypothetical protein J7639_00240 [Paenibacillaceae bacterium]|nr:hypothetical protein [Paenibacillaceae bacterium]
MTADSAWIRFVEQLNVHLCWQNNKLLELEQLLRGIERDVQALKDQPKTRIDKIEYSFDQLKVEKLEGTLTIGMAPGTGNIEDLAVNGESRANSGETAAADPAVAEANRQIGQYIDTELPQHIDRLTGQLKRTFGAEYRKLVMDDIRKQVDDRIDHYYKQFGIEKKEGRSPDTVAGIVAKVKRDIETALANHFKEAKAAETNDTGEDEA